MHEAVHTEAVFRQLYSANSYLETKIVLNSSDPVLASITKVELLQLLGVVESPYRPSAPSDLTALTNLTINHTTRLAVANDPTHSARMGSALLCCHGCIMYRNVFLTHKVSNGANGIVCLDYS